MTKESQFRFVSLLALELDNGDISLPSLPDVVMKIRKLLESQTANSEQIGRAVSVDPVLASRLFVLANSAYHNRAGIDVDSLQGAIGRLGSEVVRSTAISLAMKQLYSFEEHRHATPYLREIWAKGMKLSCMSYAVALGVSAISAEEAYLCGLMHGVGKLYIVTKMGDFPELLGNPESVAVMFDNWNSQISKSIIESWGFTNEMAQSADSEHYLDEDPLTEPKLVDVVWVAKLLIDDAAIDGLALDETAAFGRLGIDKKSLPDILGEYREKLRAMQQSLN